MQDGQSALHVSSRLDDYDTALLLLQNSADVDALMHDNYTPLHVAVKHQHCDIVSLLLSHAAKVDIKSKVCFIDFEPFITTLAAAGDAAVE